MTSGIICRHLESSPTANTANRRQLAMQRLAVLIPNGRQRLPKSGNLFRTGEIIFHFHPSGDSMADGQIGFKSAFSDQLRSRLPANKQSLFGHLLAYTHNNLPNTRPQEHMTLVRSASPTSLRPMPSSETTDFPLPNIVFGHTAAMQDVRRKIELISKIDVPVLLQGESGTGKDLCAQLIHHGSSRCRNAFVKVNCPAIPSSLIETELFGYDKGAFTGASQAKQGRVEQAHLGTLVFDEVGSLDGLAQSKLLQVLQDGTFTRVGGHEVHRISTRVVSIANSDLRKRVEDGTFRLDLLYRINAITISLPPLRERREDLLELVSYFSTRHAAEFHTSRRPFSKGILRLMHDYDWPGNIRQLNNMVRSYTLLGDEELIASELTPNHSNPDQVMASIDINKPLSLKRITKKATHDLERHIIMKVLHANGWNRQKTAKWLQISYRSLLYKLSEAEESKNSGGLSTSSSETHESDQEALLTASTACSLQA